MKKPPKLLAAIELAETAKRELDAAQEAVRQCEQKLNQALRALRTAQVDADGALPQCNMERVFRSSGMTEPVGRVAILRRTPGGLLVVRQVGEPQGMERQFRWSAHRGVYVEKVRQQPFVHSTLTLFEVPEEYAGPRAEGSLEK